MMGIGDRIRQARVAAGLSLRGMAERASPLTHTAIANYEKGHDFPRAEVLLKLARAANVKPEFFFRRVQVSLDCPRYRKSSKLSQTQQRSIEERVRERVERYLEVEAVFPGGRLDPVAFDRSAICHVQNYEDAETAASNLRRKWDLGTDAIENLSDTLEDRGIRVINLDGTVDFDGFSCWANGNIPVVVASNSKSWDRQRFDLAHELGELTLSTAEGLDAERVAHRFAGAFLAPREAVLRELGHRRSHLDGLELAMLKQEYGLSIQAWIFRAKDSGVINEDVFKQMFRRLSASGLRKDEGTPAQAPEKPWRFDRLVRQAQAEGYITPSRSAELLGDVPAPRSRPLAEEQLRRAVAEAREHYQTDPEARAWAAFAGDTVDG